MTGLTEAAPAKVNLYLHVLARRADGYHELDSLAVFAAAGDMLTAAPDEELRLTLDGPFAGGLATDDDNLVLRAARALARAGAVTAGARLALDKRLPVASGIGGGSSDAAAALRLLSRLWKLAPAARLDKVAAKLGADVPVCLVARPARMTGIGKTLAPAPRLPRCGLALVNPGTAVATAEVFRCRQGAFSTPAALPSAWESVAAMAADLAQCRNDLEGPAMVLCPPIGDVLAALRALPGCLLARMSGSGATCFGLFADPVAAKAAAGVLARPGWWVWGGGLATD